MMLFGLVDQVAPLLAPISPLRLLGWLFDIGISKEVLAASVIAIPANFGSTAAGALVQQYINSRVPVEQQGATFGLQEVQENVFTLAVVVLLGGLSALGGSKVVFVLAPAVALLLVISLIRYSYHVPGKHDISRREAIEDLVGKDEPDPVERDAESSGIQN
jgi:hypothetical protein